MDEYRVMIVEDDPMVMQIHSDYLAKAGGSDHSGRIYAESGWIFCFAEDPGGRV